MSVDNAVANIRGIRTGIKVKMLEAQKQSMKTYKSFMVGFIAIGIDLLHLALIRGIFTLCRSYVMTLHRWSSVFGRGKCSPIHFSHHASSELFSIAEVLHVAVRLTTACPLMRMILFDGSYV